MRIKHTCWIARSEYSLPYEAKMLLDERLRCSEAEWIALKLREKRKPRRKKTITLPHVSFLDRK
jgi:hypothetical protein